MISIFDAVNSLAPNSEITVTVDGEIIWHKPDVAPVTNAQIEAEVARLQAEYDAKQYQRDRAKAYPSLQAQLDMQYWDSVNGTTTWVDAVAAVKAQFPKPTE